MTRKLEVSEKDQESEEHNDPKQLQPETLKVLIDLLTKRVEKYSEIISITEQLDYLEKHTEIRIKLSSK